MRSVRVWIMLATTLLALPLSADGTDDGNRGYFGFRYDVEAEGLHVTTVLDGSPAQAAGLLPGDLIREVDGVGLRGKDQLQVYDLLGQHGAGEEVQLAVIRDDRLLTVDLTLGELPAQYRWSGDHDRLRRKIDDDQAIQHLIDLVGRSRTFLVRQTTKETVHLKPKLPNAEWEPASSALVRMLTLALGKDMADLHPGEILEVRATPGDQRVDLKVVKRTGPSAPEP